MSSYRSCYTTTSIPHTSIARPQQTRNGTISDLAQYFSPTYQSVSPLTQDDCYRSIAILDSRDTRQTLQHRIDSFMQADFLATYGIHTHQSSRNDQYRSQLPLGTDYQASNFLVQPTAPWSSMYASENTYSSMGLEVASPVHGLIRQRSHQRTPSASTVASNGPLSPNNISSSNPQIANTDYDPDFRQTFSKDPPVIANPAYLSVEYTLGNTDMKGFAFDDNQIEDFSTPSSGGLSLSSMEDSPVTPVMTSEETDVKQNKNEFRLFNPSVQLTRTESAVYQDELYNPANFRSITIAKPAKPQAPTSNAHRTLMSQRLETANQARNHSPTSNASRDRFPFTEGSSLAPADGTPLASARVPREVMSAAATRARQLKEERDEVERSAIRRPQLQREPTKTISPKDALLDYNENGEQPSLFQDTIPLGYKQHLGSGNDVFRPEYLSQQQNPSFTLPPSSSQTSMAGFRAAGAADAFNNPNFTFTQPPIPASANTATTNAQNPFQLYQQISHLTPTYPATTVAPSIDATPDFPAHLTSMESSISEGPPMSSQDSGNIATLQRPADTRANTGTYTCTYHGCSQRFDSPASLQRHKREYHRSQQHHRDSLSVKTSSASPRSTASPGPTSNSGLTSAQILARNSQAGPHRCTRINPSTGKPCSTIFSRPYDLTRHEDTIHNGRKQKVRCPYCREEKTFSRNDALTRHMRVVHPDIENFGKRGRRGD